MGRTIASVNLVILVLLVHVHLTGSAKYTLYMESLNFESARNMCKAKGGDLVDFRSEVSKAKTMELMVQKDVSQIWINAQETLNPWLWASDCTLLRNQGCYLDKSTVAANEFMALKAGETPDMAQYYPLNPLRRDQCLARCQTNNHRFASLQKGSQGSESTLQNLCGCGPSYGKYNVLAISNCPAKCAAGQADEYCPGGSHYASVFAVGGTEYPEWTTFWHEERSKYDNCGGFEFSQESSVPSAFKMFLCGLDHVPLCEVQPSLEDSFKLPKSQVWVRLLHNQASNWYEARKLCQGLQGADLLKVDTKDKVDDLMGGGGGVLVAGTYWIGAIKTRWPWLNEPQLCPTAGVQWPSNTPRRCLLYKHATGLQEERLAENCNDKTSAYVCTTPEAADTSSTTTTTTTVSSHTPTPVGGKDVQDGQTSPTNRGALVGGYVILIVVTFCFCEMLCKFVCCAD